MDDLPKEYSRIMQDQKDTLDQVFRAKARYDSMNRIKDYEFYTLLAALINDTIFFCTTMVMLGFSAVLGYRIVAVLCLLASLFTAHDISKISNSLKKIIESNAPTGNN